MRHSQVAHFWTNGPHSSGLCRTQSSKVRHTQTHPGITIAAMPSRSSLMNFCSGTCVVPPLTASCNTQASAAGHRASTPAITLNPSCSSDLTLLHPAHYALDSVPASLTGYLLHGARLCPHLIEHPVGGGHLPLQVRHQRVRQVAQAALRTCGELRAKKNALVSL